MDFKCTATVKYPLPLVWDTLRDHLPEIAAAQDDIEYVKVMKRAKKGSATHVISTWKADPPLPGFLKSFIKPEMMVWTDDAVWDDKTHTCTFTITAHYKVENISSEGTIVMTSLAAGKNTKIIYSGIFTIEKTPASSIFMTGFVIKGIEALAAKLISHNFSKTAQALTEAIESKK